MIGRGNFQALLQFHIDAGDEVLNHHLETADCNAMYTSKEVQNEMITICGDIIRNKILRRIRDAQFFSIITDETTDSANDEQLSISVQFIKDGIPREKFLGFAQVWALLGIFLPNSVSGSYSLSFLEANPMMKLVQWQGKQRVITSTYSKALYTHCAVHRLNL